MKGGGGYSGATHFQPESLVMLTLVQVRCTFNNELLWLGGYGDGQFHGFPVTQQSQRQFVAYLGL